MFLSAANALNENKDWINELNVFPVPDGDTGTNMTMTIISAAKDVLAEDVVTMSTVCRAIASGALKGARGNSGVILSQLFRGFSRIAREKDVLTQNDIIDAFKRAVESAYKAVMKPKEGTILTVAKEMTEKAEEYRDGEDFDEFLSEVLKTGEETLKRTPELLPVLKQAGVVDSGGQGLMVVMHALADAYYGKNVNTALPELFSHDAQDTHPAQGSVNVSDIETADIKFGYCTEFIIKLEMPFSEKDETEFKDFLSSIGDSIVCVADDDIVKIHVHTDDPGLAIQTALAYGQLSRIKIDNMREEHEERLFKNTEALAKEQKERDEQRRNANSGPRKEIGFVQVASGEGLQSLLKDLGVDYVISGGQTMNPSTEDILQAIRLVNADTVFVFPNNSNIIMAANQAVSMTEDKKAVVIPTRSVVEGISSMIAAIPDADADANAEAMNENLHCVKDIEVTYAIRTTTINGVEIHEGDYMALSGKDILGCGPTIEGVVKEAVRRAADTDTAMITLYYGADVTEEDAEALRREVEKIVSDAEVEVVYGGQPVYAYFIAVE
ncbi:MAG: DAK2 domain-containing protein [Lachnospiraceae bacterium]|nr:DAK2 domain-containing protein [Lachnospiraceae bacterium]